VADYLGTQLCSDWQGAEYVASAMRCVTRSSGKVALCWPMPKAIQILTQGDPVREPQVDSFSLGGFWNTCCRRRKGPVADSTFSHQHPRGRDRPSRGPRERFASPLLDKAGSV